jgi:hypothetical protein
MAKSTPKLGSRSSASSWVSTGHVLSDEARKRLAGVVGLSDEPDTAVLRKMFIQMQHHLGIYPGSVQPLDNAPRAADYVSEFQTLKQHADALISALGAANSRIMEDLEAELEEPNHSTSLVAVRAAIAALITGTANRIAVYGADRGGRPKQVALGLLIDSLRKIFKTYYRGTAAGERNAELQFLRAALADAHIKIDAEKVGKLLTAHRQGKKPPK